MSALRDALRMVENGMAEIDALREIIRILDGLHHAAVIESAHDFSDSEMEQYYMLRRKYGVDS